MCERMNFISIFFLMKIKCAIYGTLDVKGYKNCKHFRIFLMDLIMRHRLNKFKVEKNVFIIYIVYRFLQFRMNTFQNWKEMNENYLKMQSTMKIT